MSSRRTFIKSTFAGAVAILGGGCGGGGGGGLGSGVGGGTEQGGTVEAKAAFDPASNVTTFWTADMRLVLRGPGQVSDPNFIYRYAHITEGSNAVDVSRVSDTLIVVASPDGTESLFIDSSSPDVTGMWSYKNEVVTARIATFMRDNKQYAGTFTGDLVPAVGDLQNVREIAPPAQTTRVSSLNPARRGYFWLAGLFPSAHAQAAPDLLNSTAREFIRLWVGRVLPAVSAFTAFLLCGGGPIGIVCALGTFAIMSLIFTTATANAGEIPRLSPSRLLAASIPVGTISYSASGSAVFAGDPCGPDGAPIDATRSMTITGTGQLVYRNSGFRLTITSTKNFGGAGVCGPFTQVETNEVPIITGATTLVGQYDDASKSYRFEFDRRTGTGTVTYTHHFSGIHNGTATGAVSGSFISDSELRRQMVQLLLP